MYSGCSSASHIRHVPLLWLMLLRHLALLTHVTTGEGQALRHLRFTMAQHKKPPSFTLNQYAEGKVAQIFGICVSAWGWRLPPFCPSCLRDMRPESKHVSHCQDAHALSGEELHHIGNYLEAWHSENVGMHRQCRNASRRIISIEGQCPRTKLGESRTASCPCPLLA